MKKRDADPAEDHCSTPEQPSSDTIFTLRPEEEDDKGDNDYYKKDCGQWSPSVWIPSYSVG
jgi:hypothetical protein